MPLFYFDLRDDEGLFPDDTGLELDTLEIAKAEAARALSDIVRDRVPGPNRLLFVIEVRDENRQSLFEARLALEIGSATGSQLNTIIPLSALAVGLGYLITLGDADKVFLWL